jgi:hypothetical protein
MLLQFLVTIYFLYYEIVKIYFTYKRFNSYAPTMILIFMDKLDFTNLILSLTLEVINPV